MQALVTGNFKIYATLDLACIPCLFYSHLLHLYTAKLITSI